MKITGSFEPSKEMCCLNCTDSSVSPLQAKFEYALKCAGIKIVTPDWITDSVKGEDLQSGSKNFQSSLGSIKWPVGQF